MPSHLRAALIAIALAAAAFATLPAATSFLPVEDVKAGMRGVGRTVFSGDDPEEFGVHVLGVLRNVVGPQRDLILARLQGGPLEDVGVMQGMSGSPVYIDGRLVGAVSYALGAFPTEPIAGITPIGEMIDATAVQTGRAASTQVRLELPITPERLAAALSQAVERIRPFSADPSNLEVSGLPREAGARLAFQLTPIATPIVLGGFTGEAAGLLEGALRQAGFSPSTGLPSARQARPGGPTLAPGDAVGVVLATGDYEMGASGTVTHVEDGRVYAFGHPFFNLGPTELPMTRASVYSLLPSLMTSQKIAVLGDVVGTVEQDRATAVAGSIGQGPSLIPIHLRLQSERGYERSFDFAVARDEFFTPLLAYLAVANALSGYERQLGTATFAIDAVTRVAGRGDVRVSDLFSGPTAASAAASAVAGPTTVLMGNDVEPVSVESLDVTIRASERRLGAQLMRVWLDETRPTAGRTVGLNVLVREYGGTEQVYTLPVAVPPHAPRTVSVLVADAPTAALWDRRDQGPQQRPPSVEQVIDTLNRQRRNSRLYVRLVASDAGAIVAGHPMPALPPSVFRVLEADRPSGGDSLLNEAVLGAWEIDTGRAVTGSRTLSVDLEPIRR